MNENPFKSPVRSWRPKARHRASSPHFVASVATLFLFFLLALAGWTWLGATFASGEIRIDFRDANYSKGMNGSDPSAIYDSMYSVNVASFATLHLIISLVLLLVVNVTIWRVTTKRGRVQTTKTGTVNDGKSLVP